MDNNFNPFLVAVVSGPAPATVRSLDVASLAAPASTRARFSFVSDIVPVADIANFIGLDDSIFDEFPDGPISAVDIDREAARFRVWPYGDIRALGFDKPAANLTADERATVADRYEQMRRPKTWEKERAVNEKREALRLEREARAASMPEPVRPDFSRRREVPAPVLSWISDEARAAITSAPVVLSKWAAKKAKASTRKAQPAPASCAAFSAAAVPSPAGGVAGARHEAVQRVSAYVSELQGRHAGRAAKLAKSLTWQLSEIDNVIAFHAAKGRDAVAALELWERGAVAAADAKVVD